MPDPPLGTWSAIAIVLIGVAGVGKTAAGRRLASALGWPFLDADTLHPPANIAKMQAGAPLTEADRVPWLNAVRDRIAQHRAARQPLVVACSALREAHRQALRVDAGVRFVYLKADVATIARRLAQRVDHFFPRRLLRSQYRTLEEPIDCATVDASRPLDSVVPDIRTAMEV